MKKSSAHAPLPLRVLDLHATRPTVDEARRRLAAELRQARRSGTRLLKIIHGYGSTGAGGRLHDALRQSLRRRQKEGLVLLVVPGEEFAAPWPAAVALLDKYPALSRDPDYARGNPGITLVEVP